MHKSQKEEELLKVGRFGLGFQSVHHITGTDRFYTFSVKELCVSNDLYCKVNVKQSVLV